MAKNMFSIVLAVYNGEKFIEDTLNSIRNQSYKDFELIIVDGASTDNTMKIVKNNSDIVKVIISEPDNGMYDAIQKGFAVASGKYYCYINSDDRLVENALELVHLKIKKSNYDLIFGDVNYLSEDGIVRYTHKALKLPKLWVKYLRRLPFAQQSSFWSAELYKRIGGFDKSLKYVADSKFLLMAYLDPNVKVGYINNVLGEFRMHSTSFTIGSSIKMQHESKAMRKDIGILGNNKLLKILFELFIKINNAKGVYDKFFYRGQKF